jgi:hypothetical protein
MHLNNNTLNDGLWFNPKACEYILLFMHLNNNTLNDGLWFNPKACEYILLFMHLNNNTFIILFKYKKIIKYIIKWTYPYYRKLFNPKYYPIISVMAHLVAN